jgi:DNA-binding transcriptional LysR family regulator
VIEAIAGGNVAVDLRLLEGDQNQIVGALRAGTIDMALIYDLGLEAAAREKIKIERLMALVPYILLAESHPLARYPTLSLRDLTEWPLVLLDSPPSADYFTSLFADIGLKPNIGLRTRSVEMVRGLVAHGLGYGLLATKPASSVSYDGRALTTRVLQDSVKVSHLALATRAGSPSGRAAEMFAERCRALVTQIDPSRPRGFDTNVEQQPEAPESRNENPWPISA